MHPAARRFPCRPTGLALALALAFARPVMATEVPSLPSNGTVMSGTGSATFTTSGNLLTVANTPGTVITWDSFSIAAGYRTHFQQEGGAASAVFNRVMAGSSPSTIAGQLTSNGRVVLINPNGITFESGASISVASLLASALPMSEANLRSGTLLFDRNADPLSNPAPASGGRVTNHAVLSALQGQIVLIGSQVTNEGTLSAQRGQVVLAAGDSVRLASLANPALQVEITGTENSVTNIGTIVTEAGRTGLWGPVVNQNGTIRADQIGVDETGTITLTATRSVNLSTASTTQASGGKITADSGSTGTTTINGRVDASSTVGRGGDITLTGREVAIENRGETDEDGPRVLAQGLGGGSIRIGFGTAEDGTALTSARALWVGSNSLLNASATSSGNGGTVSLRAAEVLRFFGTARARGGSASGDGGSVDMSAPLYLLFRGTVDALADQGSRGFLLLRSNDWTVVGNTEEGGGGSRDFSVPEVAGSSVTTSTLQGVAGNIRLQANNDLAVNAALTLGSNGGEGAERTGRSLTLQAGRSLRINNDIALAGNGSLTLVANNVDNTEVDAAGRSLSGSGSRLAGRDVDSNNPSDGADHAALIINGNLTAESGAIHIVNSNGNNNLGGDIEVNANVYTRGSIYMSAARDLLQNRGSISNLGSDGEAGSNDVRLYAGRDMMLGSVASQHDITARAKNDLILIDKATVALGQTVTQGSSIVTAQRFNLACSDDCSGAYVLPEGETFPFFGDNYTTLTIGSNGLITFGSSNADSGSDSSSHLASRKAIAPAWNDWKLSGSDDSNTQYGVYTLYNPNARTLTVRWLVRSKGGDDARNAQFEAVLSLNGSNSPGNITFNYGNANRNFKGDVTIGISDGSGTPLLSRLDTNGRRFSLNRLASTTFQASAGEESESVAYTENLSATSNWQTSLSYVASEERSLAVMDNTDPSSTPGHNAPTGLLAKNSVTLTATDGSLIDRTSSDNTAVTAKSLVATAGNAILGGLGALRTAIEKLRVTVGGGGVEILNNSEASPASLSVLGLTSDGAASIENYGALNVDGAVRTSGALSLKTHSPIAVNATISAGGNVSLLANGTSDNRIVVNQPIYSSGNVTIQGSDGFTLNSTITGRSIEYNGSTRSGSLLGGDSASSASASQQTLLANSKTSSSTSKATDTSRSTSNTDPDTTSNANDGKDTSHDSKASPRQCN